MTDLIKELGGLATNAVAASRKRRQIATSFKNRGLLPLGKGAYLGFRNGDVVSGFVVEGSPLDTYISAFLLPAFDRLEFVSWSLGARIIHCSLDRDTQVECAEAIAAYTNELLGVRTSADLVEYLNTRQVTGHYPVWVRYICYLKQGCFDAAIKYLDREALGRLHRKQIEKFAEINPFALAHDADGIERLLASWSATSERIFGPFDKVFDPLNPAPQQSEEG